MTKSKLPKSQKKANGDKQQTQQVNNTHADTAVGSMCQDSAQPMERHAPVAERWDISGRCDRVGETEWCMSWK